MGVADIWIIRGELFNVEQEFSTEGENFGVQAGLQVHPTDKADGRRVSELLFLFLQKFSELDEKCLSKVSDLSRNQSGVTSFFSANLPQKNIQGKSSAESMN